MVNAKNNQNHKFVLFVYLIVSLGLISLWTIAMLKVASKLTPMLICYVLN